MFFQRLITWFAAGCLFAGLPALAQDAVGPIVITDAFSQMREANAYQLDDGNLALLSDTLHVLNAALSPDGRFLAVNVVAPVFFESAGCSGPIPADLWLLNLETGDHRMLSEQPENATHCGDDNNISRSRLDWSPDSSQFVWTEYHSGNDTLSLGVYDRAAGQTNLVPLDFPEQLGAGPGPVTPQWLSSGIAFYSLTYDEALGDGAVSIRLYMPDGTFIAETPVWTANEYGMPDTMLLITHRGRDYAAYHWFRNDHWELYDLLNQQKFWFGGTRAYPELVSAAQPETSLRVRLLPVEAYVANSGNPYQVEMLDSSGNVLSEPMDISFADDIPQVVVFSPDGQTLAFRRYNADTGVYENQIDFMGAAATPAFIPGEDITRFSLAWGSWQWVFPDDLELVKFPDVLG